MITITITIKAKTVEGALDALTDLEIRGNSEITSHCERVRDEVANKCFEEFLNEKSDNGKKIVHWVIKDVWQAALEIGKREGREELQAKNKALKSDLELALEHVDLDIPEHIFLKVFKLLVINNVKHKGIRWNHPEVIDDTNKIRGKYFKENRDE